MGAEPVSAAESVGQRLRRLRKERGLSQRELASPGVSYAYISRIEAGTRQPSVKALRRLAAKLAVSPEYLETGSDLDAAEERELRLGNAELTLRLGNGHAAEPDLARVLEESVHAGDGVNANRARVALGFAAHARGDHRLAAKLLEEAIGAGIVTPIERLDANTALARTYTLTGAPERGVELLQTSLADARAAEPYDAVLEVRYATALSRALSDAGDLPRAGTVLTEALDHARGATADPYMRARLYWSLAQLAEQHGQGGAALHHIRHAMASLEATDDALHLGRAHLLCAAIFVSQGRTDAALDHLQEAEQLLRACAGARDMAMLRVQRSRAEATAGQGEAAVASARDAIALLEGRDESELGAAYAALAEGLTLTEDYAGAEGAFTRAVEQLEREERWREATQVAQAWGKMLRKAGREKDALDVLERASELGLQLSKSPARDR